MKFRTIFKDLKEGFLISWNASKKYAIYNILLSFILALLPLLSLWFIKHIIDIVTRYENASREDFIYAIVTLVIVQLIQAGVQQVLTDIQTVQQQLVIDHLSQRVLEKAISVEYPYYENAEYFNSLHLAQQEVIYRASLLTSGFNQLFQSGLSMLMLFAVFIKLNWWYGVLVIVASIPVLIIKWKHVKATQELEKANLVNERRSIYLSRLLTGAVHAKEVRSYFYGQFFIEKFIDLRRQIFLGKKRLSVNQAWSETIIQAVEIVILAFIIFNLGMSTLDGFLTAGSFIFYLQALQRVQSGFKSFIGAFTLLFRQRFFLTNISGFLDLPLTRNSTSDKLSFPSPITKGITLNDVSFSYSASGPKALDHLNMEFKPGQVTAIIGENGSGKSTLIKLLSKLYRPETGSIAIDGNDIDNINTEAYARHVSVIFQDYNQYHFSLTDNITLGHTKDDGKLSSAETDADLTSLLQTLPKGYNTMLGKMFGDDAQLSGGQWQKIAIARMLYREAEILILDEPTSNIDPLAEYEILQRITAKKEGKIIILVTHRLHNLKFADHIYLMEHGKLKGEGSLNTLLATNQLFQQMYERQQLNKTAPTI